MVVAYRCLLRETKTLCRIFKPVVATLPAGRYHRLCACPDPVVGHSLHCSVMLFGKMEEYAKRV